MRRRCIACGHIAIDRHQIVTRCKCPDDKFEQLGMTLAARLIWWRDTKSHLMTVIFLVECNRDGSRLAGHCITGRTHCECKYSPKVQRGNHALAIDRQSQAYIQQELAYVGGWRAGSFSGGCSTLVKQPSSIINTVQMRLLDHGSSWRKVTMPWRTALSSSPAASRMMLALITTGPLFDVSKRCPLQPIMPKHAQLFVWRGWRKNHTLKVQKNGASNRLLKYSGMASTQTSSAALPFLEANTTRLCCFKNRRSGFCEVEHASLKTVYSAYVDVTPVHRRYRARGVF